jgi:hypothetical protein
VFIVVLVGLGASLALNTALGSGAFELATLQQRHADLMDAQQQAAQRLATLETPASLAKKARVLGMSAAVGPAFLSVDNATIVGPGVPAALATDTKALTRPVVPVTRRLVPVIVKAPPPLFAKGEAALSVARAAVIMAGELVANAPSSPAPTSPAAASGR